MVMGKSLSDRVLATPSAYARQHYLYVQEIGTLTSMEPHISSRENISSYLFSDGNSGGGVSDLPGEEAFYPGGGLCVYQLPEPVCPRKYGGASVDFDVGAF